MSMEEKTKEKGDIRRVGKIVANAVGFLNGDIQNKNAQVPIIMIDYMPPESAHPYAQGERFKLWIKLEDCQYHEIVKQLKPELKEISVWLTAEQRERLRSFLNGEDVQT